MIGVIVAIVFCVAIPVVVMAMLAPSLDKTAPKTGNFRGAMVYNGLGIVWFVWLISYWIGAHLLVVLHIPQPAWISYVIPIFPVLAGSCAFGLFDDWAGSNATKGFKGHLKALVRGQLTTGGLKFLGIGFLSLFLAVSLYYHGASTIPRVVLVTCVVALTANLMNLFDLRPGRAQKMYLLGLVICVLFVVGFGITSLGSGGALVVSRLAGFDIIALALAALGPLLAVWRFDLGEKGMIGDAGANSMGVFLGFLIATALPTWALAIVAVGLAVINLLSERFSFSKIIAANRVLAALDDLGRKKEVMIEQSDGRHDGCGDDRRNSGTSGSGVQSEQSDDSDGADRNRRGDDIQSEKPDGTQQGK